MTPPKALIADSISQRGVEELSRDNAIDVTIKTGPRKNVPGAFIYSSAAWRKSTGVAAGWGETSVLD